MILPLLSSETSRSKNPVMKGPNDGVFTWISSVGASLFQRTTTVPPAAPDPRATAAPHTPATTTTTKTPYAHAATLKLTPLPNAVGKTSITSGRRHGEASLRVVRS